MINNLRHWCLIVWLLAGVQPALAQDHVQQAPLPAIKTTGFYNVILTPEIVAGSTGKRFSDVRIYEGVKDNPVLDAMEEVPYLLRQESGGYDHNSFREFQILENKQVPRGNSILLFSNEGKLDHFEMIVKNTWVRKKINISGSNDRKKWYAVTEEGYFNPETAATDSSGTALISTIHIPATDYRFYRLLINDSATAPLNFIKLGQYNIVSGEARYLPVPAPKLIVNNADKQTVLQLQFAAAYLVNKLSFTITAPALYHRQATLNIAIKTSKGVNYIPQQQFTLSSGQPAEVVLDNAVKGKMLYLFIENEDNPALKIDSIHAWQANIYLTAYLEEGKSYILKIGDTTLLPPKYDLSYFTDSLGAAIPSLHTGKLTKSLTPGLVPPVFSGMFRNRYWIWAAMIAISTLIGTLAYLMIRELDKKKKS
jgi:hypothetical protein